MLCQIGHNICYCRHFEHFGDEVYNSKGTVRRRQEIKIVCLTISFFLLKMKRAPAINNRKCSKSYLHIRLILLQVSCEHLFGFFVGTRQCYNKEPIFNPLPIKRIGMVGMGMEVCNI